VTEVPDWFSLDIEPQQDSTLVTAVGDKRQTHTTRLRAHVTTYQKWKDVTTYQKWKDGTKKGIPLVSDLEWYIKVDLHTTAVNPGTLMWNQDDQRGYYTEAVDVRFGIKGWKLSWSSPETTQVGGSSSQAKSVEFSAGFFGPQPMVTLGGSISSSAGQSFPDFAIKNDSAGSPDQFVHQSYVLGLVQDHPYVNPIDLVDAGVVKGRLRELSSPRSVSDLAIQSEALFHNPNPKEGDTPRLEIEITHRLMDVEKTWATAFGKNDPQSHGFAPPQTGDGAFDRTRGGPQRILMSQQFGGLLVDVYPVTHKEVWKFDFDMTKKKVAPAPSNMPEVEITGGLLEALGTIAALTGPSGTPYAYFINTQGHVQAVFFSTDGRWLADDLTTKSKNAPLALKARGTLAATTSSPTAHRVYFVAEDGHVWLFWLNSVGPKWELNDLTGAPLAVEERVALAAIPSPNPSADSRAFFVDKQGHVQALWYNTDSNKRTWVVDDLTKNNKSAPLALKTRGALAATTTSDPSLAPQVFFVGQDGHVWLFWLNTVGPTWELSDLTAATGAPTARGPLAAVPAVPGSKAPRGYFISVDGHVYVLWHNTDSKRWMADDLTYITGAPSALGPLAAIPDPSGGSRAYFIGVDGHVYVLSPDRDPKASGWTALDLTRATGANAAGAGLAASVAPDGAQYVYFTDRYGKLYVLSKRTYTQPWDCKQFLPVGRS
jgi:hypothetical protein